MQAEPQLPTLVPQGTWGPSVLDRSKGCTGVLPRARIGRFGDTHTQTHSQSSGRKSGTAQVYWGL